MQLRIHCVSLRLWSQSITWTLSRCVELLCSVSLCAINTRFVWVLPLLLPFPVSSWSDSSLGLRTSGWGSVEVGVRGWSSQPASVTPGISPRKGPGPPSSVVHCSTRAIHQEPAAVSCSYCSHRLTAPFLLSSSPKGISYFSWGLVLTDGYFLI